MLNWRISLAIFCIYGVLVECGSTTSPPKNLYYFSSTDIVFGEHPIVHVIDLATGDTVKSQTLTQFPRGTVLSALNKEDSETDLLLFGYRKIPSGWEYFLSSFNVNEFNMTTVASVNTTVGLDLFDPAPSFGYDADLNAIFDLFTIEGYMNITKYDFNQNELDYIYVPNPSSEPLNFQPSGAYDSVNKVYYINFYNENSELEIAQYGVESGQLNSSHIYAHYPNYPITNLFVLNGELYASYNQGNFETLFYRVNQNNNTFTLLANVPDNIGFGETVFAYNQNYIVFITHLSKTKILLTTLNVETLEKTTVTSPISNFPNYPLPVPVAAVL
ncbi:hypothetical protein DLAC_00548 [Tieghemostelium lacteum]|uniref:Uncharacterized protein n=1 Tax=Tieghemostelium lacteum TaxID=361077 RepID=A0A152AAF6_TIELA|nr:hypothetical protein DLAC_00548 [Tieghemostelium lacteum]|eukprot:KYR03057.1 hypothetical protein DLAC_00548 [Tieghemostelium lacteum]